MIRAFVLGAVASSVLAAPVRADPCPPSADLAGDPALVGAVRDLLSQHGVETPTVACLPSSARLERRGAAIVVVRMGAQTEERIVSDLATAATVIESWSRNDFEGPLLTHPVIVAAPLVVVPSRPLREAATQAAAAYVTPRSIQGFAAGEASIADDQTSWLGVVLGMCIQVGRVCVSARGRMATVVDGAGMWDERERHAADVLFGGDIPFALGPTTLTIGFGTGMGSVHTGSHATGMAQGSETFGLRGDAHVGWAILVGHGVAIDLTGAIDVSQVTDVEGSLSAEASAEPRLFARVGAGLRFGVR